ncbi:HAD family hydrolase [Clostridium beijerinckii]|uniref:Uncharacterized protein n=1 Tax=Clostridium beijerinckii TaxID=1520 RepID=A0A1S9N8E6_CLOBE|nr:HAD-IA family hydrolase [Clostridium beijerinckii]OOP73816.1 hypothetical protein CBEIBR21_04765 [Clostridium beijerinckii]
MNNYRKIQNIVDGYKIISFDIFDTLLKRNVMKPSDIFYLVEKEYNLENEKKILNFKKLRVEAESTARMKSNKEDILLSEIYKELDVEDIVATKLMEIELKIEQDFLMANQDIKTIYEYALSKGKKIIIISDMYLPKKFIESILHRCGYKNYTEIYISSEIGYLKSSGKLFQYILKLNKFNPKDILHIGDAKKGDWLMPKLYGIKSIKLNTFDNHLIYTDENNMDINKSIITAFINNRYVDDRYNQIGSETLGPLIWGFCEWLHSKVEELNINTLLFFARDGYLIKKAYDIIYPDDNTEYVYVSRRSLTVPLLYIKKSKEEILKTIPLNRFTKLSVVIDRLGLDSREYKEIVQQCGFRLDSILSKEEYFEDDNFNKLFETIKEDIYNNSNTEYKNFIEYINKFDVSGNVAIIDIGWKGTMQRAFDSLLSKCNFKYNLYGFYLGTLDNNNSYGYIFNGENDEKFYELVSFTGLFELMFSGVHGSVKKYNDEGSVELYDFEFDCDEKSRKDYEYIKKIQNGAIEFIYKFADSHYNKYLTWSNDLAFEAIKNFGIAPSKKDLYTLGDMYFFDNEKQYLAKPNLKYLFSPERLKKDLSLSTWKIGYLRRLIKISFPYLKLYKFLRKRVQ